MITTAPLCPHGHGPMKHVVLECYDRVIGCAWFCVNDDRDKRDYCDECANCDCTPAEEPQPQQLGLFEAQL